MDRRLGLDIKGSLLTMPRWWGRSEAKLVCLATEALDGLYVHTCMYSSLVLTSRVTRYARRSSALMAISPEGVAEHDFCGKGRQRSVICPFANGRALAGIW